MREHVDKFSAPGTAEHTAGGGMGGYDGTHPMIHVGSRATLLLEGRRIHIQLQVLCGQSGDSGDKIQVTTMDRKQVYTAEILASNVVRGDL